MKVTIKSGLVDRVDRTETHRHGGVFPEFGHQPRVRVARQALALDFGSKVVKLGLVEATLKVRPGVDTRGGVTLKVDGVAGQAPVFSFKEVVEPDFVKRS